MLRTITIFTIFLTLVAFTFLTENETAYSNYSQPPSFNSGAPGQSSCNSGGCHVSFEVNSGDGSVTINFNGGFSAEYEPGETYSMSVAIEQAGASRFGFQMVAYDGTDTSVGDFIEGDNTGIQNVANINFINHKNPSNTPSTYSFEWTAPSTDVGPITFYTTGNAANGAQGPNGDRIYTTNLTIDPTEVVVECLIEVSVVNFTDTTGEVEVSNANGNATIQWVDELDNVVATGAMATGLMPETTYTIIATDDEDCQATTTVTTDEDSTVGIYGLNKSTATIGPNPASTFINVVGMSSKTNNITIYNLKGAIVGNWQTNGVISTQINLPSTMVSGTYIVAFESNNVSSTQKLVVAK